MLLSFGQGSLRRAVPPRPGQQLLPDGSPPRPCQSALASRQVSSCFPMLLQRRILVPGHPAERSGNFSAQTSASLHPLQRFGQQQTSSGGEKYSGLASNLAHLGRICELAAAVCGLSQHLLTYMRPSPLLPPRAAAQTDANLSAHLHRLPTPPTYLRRMRLPPGQGRRCLVLDEACRLTGVQVLYAGYGCSLAGCGVPANHRARESLF